MPAIELSKLTKEIELLLRLWEQPNPLLARLTDLLEYYADHLYQPGEQTRTTPTLPVYRVPPIVLRQLERSFTHAALEKPQPGLALADALWQQTHQENLALSAAILGGLPTAFHPAVIQRISNWASIDLPSNLASHLIDLATRQIRLHSLQGWLNTVATWLQGEDPAFHSFGLLALQPLIKDPQFENLPFVFRVITPYIQTPPAEFIPELVEILGNLAQRSPSETTYFFRQSIHASSAPETLRLLRRALPFLPQTAQSSLGPELRESDI